jgi:heme-degrading monooxygenase HmoA
MTAPCKCPDPPYYSAIFANQRTAGDVAGYDAMADRMVALAASQPGFLGVDSARDAHGFGITVSYWRDLEAIENWRINAEHLEAQQLGRDKWYESFSLRVARVERANAGPG